LRFWLGIMGVDEKLSFSTLLEILAGIKFHDGYVSVSTLLEILGLVCSVLVGF
jgi:hypothetical protein